MALSKPTFSLTPIIGEAPPARKVKESTLWPKMPKSKKTSIQKSVDQLLDNLDTVSITESRINIIGSEDIVSLAVCEVTVLNKELRNDENRLPYDPRNGTIDDPRTGVLDKDMLCATCSQPTISCIGHLSYIRLPQRVVHPLHRKLVCQIMNIFCVTCGLPKYNENIFSKFTSMGIVLKLAGLSDALSEKKNTRNDGVHEKCEQWLEYTPGLNEASLTQSKRSSVARDFDMDDETFVDPNAARSKSIKDTDTSHSIYYYINPKDKKTRITVPINTVERNLALISSVSSDELRRIGFHSDKPLIDFSGLIPDIVPVLPPVARPYGMIRDEMSMNPLSKIYLEILEATNVIRGQHALSKRAERNYNNSPLSTLYNKIINLIDQVKEQLKGKDGIIRGSAMGKRVDFSGRSVLNPWNKLPFGYIACPSKMRMTHTLPITVAEFNLKALTELFLTGKIPWITNMRDRSYQRTAVDDKLRSTYIPRIGDIVEVMGMNGDEIIFNRQPTLDKLSIMGYKTLYVDDPAYMCVGLHSSYTTPHNADFDGDEGNIHKIQSLDARAEVRYIASVESCIMNPKANKPTMGLVYNCLSSAYILTSENTIVEDFIPYLNLLKSKEHIPSFANRLQESGVNPKSGRALFSILLPQDFYYNKGKIKIRNGILMTGPLTDSNLGPVSGSIVHILWKFYGKERTVRFFTEGQQLLDTFIEKHGFSVGYRSCVASNPTQVASIIQAELDEANIKIAALGPKTDEMTPIELEIHEKKVISYLNGISRIGKKISLDAIASDNPLNIMMNSGAKGKETNIAQIIGCLGQQFVMGARPKRNITGNTRSLPYFEPHSDDIEADGFVPESFLVGSKPSGFIYHMMASRIGLMDTALKTADIGHMHHRMVKVLEDLTLRYDGSVRNANDVIFMYSYSDGFSASEIMPTSSNSLGNTLSFIDLDTTIGRLNAAEGY